MTSTNTTTNTPLTIEELEAKHILPYKKDTFQLDGDKALFERKNVFVVAATGCGKSTLAEFAIIMAIETNRLIYITTPVIALALQYYNMYSKQYNNYNGIFEARVGLKTGNHIINPMGNIIIVTAEVLENELNQRDVRPEFNDCIVVMDEVHNINNPDRGAVWENTIATLPPKATLLMLSATIDEPERFAHEVELSRGHETVLVSKYGRTVPLRVKLVQPRTLSDTSTAMDEDFIQVFSTDTTTPFDAMAYDAWVKEWKLSKGSVIYRLNQMVRLLQLHDGLPAIDFVFSKKMCHKFANSVSLNLLTSAESTEMKHTIKQKLRSSYKTLETLECFQEYERLLLSGISYHHSGMLPILRELTETLFREKKIKLIFATETLAIGVNMPTRSVVFHDFKKPSKDGFVPITSDSYSQMSGRAGRRGMDVEGNVYINPLRAQQILPSYQFGKIIAGSMPKIESKFVMKPRFVLGKVEHHTPDDVISKLWRQIQNNRIARGIDNEVLSMKGLEEGVVHNASVIRYHELTYRLENERYLGHREIKKMQKECKKISKAVDNFKVMSSKYKKYLEIKKMEDAAIGTRDLLTRDWFEAKDFLTHHGFLNSDSQATRMGKIAQTVHDTDPLVLGWVVDGILTHEYLKGLEFKHIAAWLSIFLDGPYDHSTKKEYTLKDAMRDTSSDLLKDTLEETAYAHETLQAPNRSYHKLNYINVRLIISWIESSHNVTKTLNGLESYHVGTFVKTILRLINLIEHLRPIFLELKEFHLYNLLEDSASKLMFDVVSNVSLYLEE